MKRDNSESLAKGSEGRKKKRLGAFFNFLKKVCRLPSLRVRKAS